jgi:hypothetical protein
MTDATREEILGKWETAQRKVFRLEAELDAARKERNRILSEGAKLGLVLEWNENYLRGVS